MSFDDQAWAPGGMLLLVFAVWTVWSVNAAGMASPWELISSGYVPQFIRHPA